MFKHASPVIETSRMRVNLNKLHFALACLYRNRQYYASVNKAYPIYSRILRFQICKNASGTLILTKHTRISFANDIKTCKWNLVP